MSTMAEESNSDWDSISEAPKNAGSKNLQQQPPFDFSSEVQPNSAPPPPPPPGPPSSSAPGRAKPRKENAYRLSTTSESTRKAPPPRRQKRTDSAEESISETPRVTRTTTTIPRKTAASKRPPSAATQSEASASGSANTTVINTAPNGRKIKSRLDRKDTVDQVPPIPKDPDSIESECYNPHRDARRKKNGVDNPAFRDESITIEERRDRPSSGSDSERESAAAANEAKVLLPDERIRLLHFQRPVERYFQIEDASDGVYADRALSHLTLCCTWVMSELLGMLKIPIVLIFLALGQFIMFLVNALVRPLSDFVLKPLLVSAHNLILVPSCGALHNCADLCAHSAGPVCSLFGQHCCCRGKDERGLVKEI